MIGDKIKLNNRGFSLAEILIAISIFSTIILITMGMFQSVLKGQFSAIASQNVQESLRFSLEVMSKEIRSAKGFPGGSPTCSPSTNKVYNTNIAQDELYLHNKDDDCVTYSVSGDGELVITRDDGVILSLPITPDSILISNIKFYINDDVAGAFHSKQASVTIYMEAEDITRVGFSEKIKIQTTISSRYYE